MGASERRTRAQSAAAVVGIDAGKYKHALVVRPKGGQDSKPLTFDVSREGFDKAHAFIQKATGGAAPSTVLVGIEFAGNCGFTLAHYLDQLGYVVVSVLPNDVRRWRDVVIRQVRKTDQDDAVVIVDLAATGRFVAFPFLEPVYAEVRQLVSTIERLTKLRTGAANRLRAVLHVAFPEFDALFSSFTKRRTPLLVLAAFPGPAAIVAARREKVVRVLWEASNGKHADATADRLIAAAKNSLAVDHARRAQTAEVEVWVDLVRRYNAHIDTTTERLAAVLSAIPEAAALLTFPNAGPLSVGAFLGSIGDPRCYESVRQVLAVAGLSLTEKSSGTLTGAPHISKRGRPLLRTTAFMFALSGIRKNGVFRERYLELRKRNGDLHKPALVAISRTVIRLLFAMARTGQRFDASRVGSPYAAAS